MTMVAVQNVNEHASHLATVCINQISIMNALQSARLTLKHMNRHTPMQSVRGGGGGGGGGGGLVVKSKGRGRSVLYFVGM